MLGGGSLRGSPDVICRPLGESAVLIHLGTNEIFELNLTGYRVWQLLNDGVEPEAILERLIAEFDVDRAQLDREVEALLAALSARQLIVS